MFAHLASCLVRQNIAKKYFIMYSLAIYDNTLHLILMQRQCCIIERYLSLILSVIIEKVSTRDSLGIVTCDLVSPSVATVLVLYTIFIRLKRTWEVKREHDPQGNRKTWKTLGKKSCKKVPGIKCKQLKSNLLGWEMPINLLEMVLVLQRILINKSLG